MGKRSSGSASRATIENRESNLEAVGLWMSFEQLSGCQIGDTWNESCVEQDGTLWLLHLGD
jgi:hypothetical protein